ncbi:MAG: hypothetical protein Q4C49_12760 [Bacillota bacterium]|nr:hypothetical protein [Bacillota bacterium]
MVILNQYLRDLLISIVHEFFRSTFKIGSSDRHVSIKGDVSHLWSMTFEEILRLDVDGNVKLVDVLLDYIDKEFNDFTCVSCVDNHFGKSVYSKEMIIAACSELRQKPRKLFELIGLHGYTFEDIIKYGSRNRRRITRGEALRFDAYFS